jgi:hypothetical protein
MHLKRMEWYGILAVILLFTPCLAMAQPQWPIPPHWPLFPNEPRHRPPEHFADEPRGPLEVINDWQDEVNVTVWSHHRERIGEWSIPAGQTVLFEVDGERIKVRPHYKIKVGDDWGWVDVGQVGEFQNGLWYVRVRDLWRATHGRRPTVPDWKQ